MISALTSIDRLPLPPLCTDSAAAPPAALDGPAPAYVPLKSMGCAKRISRAIAVPLLLFPIIGWLACALMRHLSHRPIPPIKAQIAQRALDKAREILHEKTTGVGLSALLQGKDEETRFAALVRKLESLIEDSRHRSPRQLNKIRALLTRLSQTDTYSRGATADAATQQTIAIIDQIASALLCDVAAADLFAAYGATLNDKAAVSLRLNITDKEHFSYREIADLATASFNVTKAWSFDRKINQSLWIIRHPTHSLRGMMARCGLQRRPVTHFNPYKAGNFSCKGGDYLLNGRTVAFFFAPTPGITKDRLFQMHLNALARADGYHLQHSLEHPSLSAEYKRLQHIDELYESNHNMNLLMTPMDGPAWYGQSQRYQDPGSRSFLNSYEEFVTDGVVMSGCGTPRGQPAYLSLGQRHTPEANGFYLPETTLPSTTLEGAFAIAHRLFDDLPDCQPAETTRRNKGLQIFIQALLATGAIAQTVHDAEGLDGPLTMGQACTMDIDRGAVMNVATRMLFLAASGEPITRQQLDGIVGAVLGRAEQVDNRRIMRDRFEGLSGFLYLLSEVDPILLQATIQEYLSTILDAPLDLVGFEA